VKCSGKKDISVALVVKDEKGRKPGRSRRMDLGRGGRLRKARLGRKERKGVGKRTLERGE